MHEIQFVGEFGGTSVRGWTTVDWYGVALDAYETEAAAIAAIEGPGGLAEEARVTGAGGRELVRHGTEWTLVDSDGEPVRNGYRLRIVRA